MKFITWRVSLISYEMTSNIRFCLSLCSYMSVLQKRRGNRDNLDIISHISPENKFCDISLEPSHGSNDRSQNMLSLRNKKNYL